MGLGRLKEFLDEKYDLFNSYIALANRSIGKCDLDGFLLGLGSAYKVCGELIGIRNIEGLDELSDEDRKKYMDIAHKCMFTLSSLEREFMNICRCSKII